VRLYILRLLHTALVALRLSHADDEEDEGAGGSTTSEVARLVDGTVKVRSAEQSLVRCLALRTNI
jgi:hypothetical protein